LLCDVDNHSSFLQSKFWLQKQKLYVIGQVRIIMLGCYDNHGVHKYTTFYNSNQGWSLTKWSPFAET